MKKLVLALVLGLSLLLAACQLAGDAPAGNGEQQPAGEDEPEAEAGTEETGEAESEPTAAATTASETTSDTDLEPVEAWQEIATLMTEARDLAAEGTAEEAQARIEEAQVLYAAAFQEEAQKLDPAVDQLVSGAFSSALEAASAGDAVQVNLDRQRVDKAIYKIAFLVLEEELAEGDGESQTRLEESQEWFAILSEKFGLYKDGEPTGAAVFMEELARKPEELDRLRPQILEELRSIFLLKVEEEVVEAMAALEEGNNDEAAEKAVEGLGYYLPIQPEVQTILGQEEEAELFHDLEELVEHARQGNLEEAEHEAEEISSLLASYKSAKFGGGLATVAGDLVGMLKLVDEEYVDAVKDGEIVDQAEYDETALFLSRAQQILESNEQAISEAEPGLVEELAQTFEEIGAIVEAKGDPAEMTALVATATERLSALAEAAGPSVGEVELTSVTAAPGAEITIELKAEGVPESPGLGAYDVTVTFDPALLSLQEATFVYGDGVADIQEGQARLAAFKAQDGAGGEVTLAELRFTVAEEASGTVDVALAVNELADIEGNALSVTEVENGVITVEGGE